MRAGTYAVLRSQDALDRINVFPVADADTGANLVATLTAASAALGKNPPSDIGPASRLAADAALIGARGNSGAIFAQFLDGLAGGLHLKREVSTGEFALAATAGVDAAYLAVQEPREGTILSVLRAWARYMEAWAQQLTDFRELMGRSLDAARIALADTPLQLEVLRRNKVVDAGGQGLVYFLEGWLGTLQGHAVIGEHVAESSPLPDAYQRVQADSEKGLRAYRAVIPGVQAGIREPEYEYRYCAQVLMTGQKLDREAVRSALEGQGDSLVIAGGSKRMNVHIHTDDADLFHRTLASLGTVEDLKVDDLVEQQAQAKAATTAIVIDSTCDLSEAAQLRLGTVMVPLNISIGGREYLDRVELAPADFYPLVRQNTELPRSSQPNRTDFRRVFEALLEEHEAIVSIHISSRLSGTYQAALGAAQDVDPQRIKVVDSRHVSVGIGLVVEAAGEAIRAGASLEEVAAAAEAAAADTRVFSATPSLEFAVKGGRVKERPARAADLIRLKPVILFDGDGTIHLDGAHLGFNRTLRALARRTMKFADGGPVRLAVTHADSPSNAEYLLRHVRRYFPMEDIPMLEAGAVLATHTGLGAVAVAVRRLPREENDQQA